MSTKKLLLRPVAEKFFVSISSLPETLKPPSCGEFEELIMVCKDRRDVWWATPK